MAFIQAEFKSETLELNCSINVVLSEQAIRRFGPGHRSPTLYLLHGLSDDHAGWMRKTSVERYAEEYDLAIVMPAAHRSFYTDTQAGHRYFDFIANELPQVARSMFPLSDKPQANFVAGLSMGGYGAFKLALRYPERYAAAASLSGALDLLNFNEDPDEMLPEWKSVFGELEQFKGSENDLLSLASRIDPSAAPALFQYCGTNDYLYSMNQSFLKHCRSRGIQIDYSEDAGDHSWSHWDREIQTVLDWLPIEKIEPEVAPAD